jgi:hypothetical protein
VLYWLSVYLLVVIVVALPFLLLYVAGLVFWLAVSAIGSMTRRLRKAFAVRSDLLRAHWSAVRRRQHEFQRNGS